MVNFKLGNELWKENWSSERVTKKNSDSDVFFVPRWCYVDQIAFHISLKIVQGKARWNKLLECIVRRDGRIWSLPEVTILIMDCQGHHNTLSLRYWIHVVIRRNPKRSFIVFHQLKDWTLVNFQSEKVMLITVSLKSSGDIGYPDFLDWLLLRKRT